jgi:hypothetical protein
MFSVDFSPYKTPGLVGEDELRKRFWVLLLVHSDYSSHTKIEKTTNVLRNLDSTGLWRVAVAVPVPDATTADKFVEHFTNATIRGSLSRSVVFEQVAHDLGFTVYNDLNVIFKLASAERLLVREKPDL